MPAVLQDSSGRMRPSRRNGAASSACRARRAPFPHVRRGRALRDRRALQVRPGSLHRGSRAARGVGQYIILGAGLDIFAQRRLDLTSRLRLKEELQLTSNTDFLFDAVALFRWAFPSAGWGTESSTRAPLVRKGTGFSAARTVTPDLALPHRNPMDRARIGESRPTSHIRACRPTIYR